MTRLTYRSIVAAALLGACTARQPNAPPPVPVTVTEIVRKDVPLDLEATGTVEPLRTVAVQAQVSGILMRVGFREGQDVKAGDLLFEIDPRQYQAALNQSEANLARDAAQYDNAKRDLQRFEALATKEYVTAQQLDQTRANVTGLAATLRADTAAAERARLDFQNATIRAPISGRAGGLLLKEGNLVRAGSGDPLVVVNQIAPILVRFAVPSNYLDAVKRRANQTLSVKSGPVGGTGPLQEGTLVFVDNAVDSMSGTVSLKASFPNGDGVLWPGALVRVILQLDVEEGALVVPRTAVQTGQSGPVVWVIDTAGRAHARRVAVLRSTDTLAVVSGAVTPGEKVVIDGQLKLTENARTQVRGAGGTDEGRGGEGGRRGREQGGGQGRRGGRGQ